MRLTDRQTDNGLLVQLMGVPHTRELHRLALLQVMPIRASSAVVKITQQSIVPDTIDVDLLNWISHIVRRNATALSLSTVMSWDLNPWPWASN